MRITFSTPVTPTRERPTRERRRLRLDVGRLERERSIVASRGQAASLAGARRCSSRTDRPCAAACAITSRGRGGVGPGSWRGATRVETALDGVPQTDASVTLGGPAIAEIERTRARWSRRATSRGSLTYERVVAALEEPDAAPRAGRRAATPTSRSTASSSSAARRRPRPSRVAAGSGDDRARPDGRAEPRLAAAVPALDRARRRC